MKLLLIDDHPLFRSGLTYLLRTLDSRLEVDEAGNCAQALALAGRDYDLVLLDLKMPGVNGLDALGNVIPGKALVEDPRIVSAAIESGAMGYIPKSSTPDVMIQALKLILAHGVYVPSSVLNGAREAMAPKRELVGANGAIEGLTERQMDVLRRMVQGKQNKVIAAELDISEGTVKLHASAVMRALHAKNRTEVVYTAAKMGLRLV